MTHTWAVGTSLSECGRCGLPLDKSPMQVLTLIENGAQFRRCRAHALPPIDDAEIAAVVQAHEAQQLEAAERAALRSPQQLPPPRRWFKQPRPPQSFSSFADVAGSLFDSKAAAANANDRD